MCLCVILSLIFIACSSTSMLDSSISNDPWSYNSFLTAEIPKVPVNILALTTEEKRKFLDSFDNVFSDIDGVLWNLNHNIEGAAEGFKELQNANKKVHFISNNSVRPTKNSAKFFEKLGLDYDVENIIHPVKSIVEYLKNIKFDGLIYVIGGLNFKTILREAGFDLIDGPKIILGDSLNEALSAAFDKEPVRAVIIDHDINNCALMLLRAQNYLRNPECLLIVGATDLVLPLTKDLSIFGPGVFAKMLAEICNREPITLGKPGKELAELLIKHYNITNTKRALMIGDMLEQDIGFGKKCGFQTLIVLSGGCTSQDLNAPSNAQLLPDYYAESMADFVEFMKDLYKSNF